MLSYIIRKLKETRGDLGALFGGGSGNQVANLSVPSFQADPNFTSSQNSLSTLGNQVLSGNLPSFYSGLGKTNSPQFQSMVSNVTGQTQQAAQGQEAIAGTGRSGVGAAASALALNNVIPGLNYQDLLNAQTQQEGLLTLGTGVEQDVAGNALTNQSQTNNFALQQFQDQYQQAAYNNSFNAMAASAQGQAISTLLFGPNGGGMSALFGGNTQAPSVSGNNSSGNVNGTNNNNSSTSNGAFGTLSNFLQSLNSANSSSGSLGITSNVAPQAPGMAAYAASLNDLTLATGA